MGVFFRMILFLLVFIVLILATAEYTQTISDTVLSTLMNIQQNDLQQEWPQILLLILMLAIPFFIFVFIYRLFVGSIIRYSHFREEDRRAYDDMESLRKNGIENGSEWKSIINYNAIEKREMDKQEYHHSSNTREMGEYRSGES